MPILTTQLLMDATFTGSQGLTSSQLQTDAAILGESNVSKLLDTVQDKLIQGLVKPYKLLEVPKVEQTTAQPEMAGANVLKIIRI